MKCKLCLKKEADQTGSHITSAFLLTSQIGKRGQEEGYVITNDPKQDYSINQGDKAIKEDKIFCRICEQRLGVVEDTYSREITQKIEAKQFEQNFEKVKSLRNNYILNSKKINPIVFHLLIQSNIWRASISKLPLYRHFELNQELQERIRANLDLFLPYKKDFITPVAYNKWIPLINETKDLFDFIPLVVIKAENIDNKEMTYEFFDNISKNPYHSIINEYIIYVFDETLKWEDDFFELRNEFELGALINKDFNYPRVGIIPTELYFKIIEKLRTIVVDERIEKMRSESITELLQRGLPISRLAIDRLVAEKISRLQL